ncbi:MAG: hypothetical protein WBP11_08325 [Dokdonella sp.]
MDLQPETLLRNIRWLGLVAIIISVGAWAMDLTGVVYVCPYCRTERTVIGLLGLIMLLPDPGHWLARYVATVFAVLGLVVAAEQHFGGWKKISSGTFTFGEQWYLSPFLLAGFALFIITGQLLLLYAHAERKRSLA